MALAHGLVDSKDREKPNRHHIQRVLQKRIGLKFVNRDATIDGNDRESEDIGGGIGKSYLVCLTILHSIFIILLIDFFHSITTIM